MIAKKILLLLPVIAAAVTIIAVLSSRQCDTVLTEVSGWASTGGFKTRCSVKRG